LLFEEVILLPAHQGNRIKPKTASNEKIDLLSGRYLLLDMCRPERVSDRTVFPHDFPL
jgi:hypothetical protein